MIKMSLMGIRCRDSKFEELVGKGGIREVSSRSARLMDSQASETEWKDTDGRC